MKLVGLVKNNEVFHSDLTSGFKDIALMTSFSMAYQKWFIYFLIMHDYCVLENFDFHDGLSIKAGKSCQMTVDIF